jgi:D-3-phosphoglycerate dehydrogenase
MRTKTNHGRITMKVLITPRSYAKHSDEPLKLLREKGFEITRNETGGIMTEPQLKEAIEGADGIIIGVDPLTADVMSAAPNLKAVAKYGVGTDNIDLAYCEEHGIRVSKTVGANSDAVADYTFALILALARKVTIIDSKCRERDWTKITTSDVAGKTLGLIGLGAIGKGVVRRSKGFGMKVIAHDVYWDEDFAAQQDITKTDPDDICRSADFITLHMPLLPDTENFIGERRLRLMKPTAFIVNTARGGLIDEKALLEALIKGEIGGAGIDVFAEEPPADARWYALENIVMGSHCAASTVGAAEQMSLLSTNNLIRDLIEK